jgi:hypothetical protein
VPCRCNKMESSEEERWCIMCSNAIFQPMGSLASCNRCVDIESYYHHLLLCHTC